MKIELVSFDLAIPVGLAALDSEERARAGVIGNALIRNRYQRSRALLRNVLGLRLGLSPEKIRYEKSPRGKPGVVAGNGGCEFSISHSGDLFVVATSDLPVGVDVEIPRRGRNILGLAERFFSGEDFSTLRAAPPPAREALFFEQWVAKEAALKAQGTGLGEELSRVVCEYGERGIVAVRGEIRVLVRPFGLGGGVPGAVGWLGGGEAVVCWRDAAQFTA